MCLGLKLKELKIERMTDLDIKTWGTSIYHPLGESYFGDNVEEFVRTSVNHLIYKHLFEELKTVLDEALVDEDKYRFIMDNIACKYGPWQVDE